jgi:HSP20 family protein
MAQAKHKPETDQQSQSAAQNQPMSPGQQGLTHERFLPASWVEGPFALMRRFSEEMDRLFGDFGTGRSWLEAPGGRGLGFPQAQWAPPIEIFERDNQLVVRADLNQLVVRADLPGLSKDDIEIETTDNMLTIAGERREEREETRGGYRHSERRYGRFSRSISLPEGVNAEDVRAAFENRVLEITVPMPQRERREQRIAIQEGPSGGAQPSGAQPKTAA